MAHVSTVDWQLSKPSTQHVTTAFKVADGKTDEVQILTKSFHPVVQPTWKWDDIKSLGID